MKKWAYRHKGWIQLVAYILVVAAAICAVIQVQNVAHDNAAAIRQSQFNGCVRSNQKTKSENVKFVALYNIVNQGLKKPQKPLTPAQIKQLEKLRRDFRPIPLTQCRQEYPPIKK